MASPSQDVSQEEGDTFHITPRSMTSPNIFGGKDSNGEAKTIYSILSPITPHVVMRGNHGRGNSEPSSYSPLDILDSGTKQQQIYKKIESIKKSARKNNKQNGGGTGGGLYQIIQDASSSDVTFGSSSTITDEDKATLYHNFMYNYDRMDPSLKPEDPNVRPATLDEIFDLEVRIQSGEFGEAKKKKIYDYLNALFAENPQDVLKDAMAAAGGGGDHSFDWSQQGSNQKQNLSPYDMSAQDKSNASSMNLSGTMKAEMDIACTEIDLAKAREKEAHYEYKNIQYKQSGSRLSLQSEIDNEDDNDNNDFRSEELALRRIQQRVAELSSKARVCEADALAWDAKAGQAQEQVQNVLAEIELKNKQKECSEYRVDLAAAFGLCRCGRPKSEHSAAALKDKTRSSNISGYDAYDEEDLSEEDEEKLDKVERQLSMILDQCAEARMVSDKINEELSQAISEANRLERVRKQQASEQKEKTQQVTQTSADQKQSSITSFQNNESIPEKKQSSGDATSLGAMPIVQRILSSSDSSSPNSSCSSGEEGSSGKKKKKHSNSKKSEKLKLTSTGKSAGTASPITPVLNRDSHKNSKLSHASFVNTPTRVQYSLDEARSAFEEARDKPSPSFDRSKSVSSNIASRYLAKAIESYDKEASSISASANATAYASAINGDSASRSGSGSGDSGGGSGSFHHYDAQTISSMSPNSFKNICQENLKAAEEIEEEFKIKGNMLHSFDASAYDTGSQDGDDVSYENESATFTPTKNEALMKSSVGDFKSSIKSPSLSPYSRFSPQAVVSKTSPMKQFPLSSPSKSTSVKPSSPLKQLEMSPTKTSSSGVDEAEEENAIETGNDSGSSSGSLLDGFTKLTSDIMSKTPNTRNKVLIKDAMLLYEKELADFRQGIRDTISSPGKTNHPDQNQDDGPMENQNGNEPEKSDMSFANNMSNSSDTVGLDSDLINELKAAQKHANQQLADLSYMVSPSPFKPSFRYDDQSMPSSRSFQNDVDSDYDHSDSNASIPIATFLQMLSTSNIQKVSPSQAHTRNDSGDFTQISHLFNSALNHFENSGMFSPTTPRAAASAKKVNHNGNMKAPLPSFNFDDTGSQEDKNEDKNDGQIFMERNSPKKQQMKSPFSSFSTSPQSPRFNQASNQSINYSQDKSLVGNPSFSFTEFNATDNTTNGTDASSMMSPLSLAAVKAAAIAAKLSPAASSIHSLPANSSHKAVAPSPSPSSQNMFTFPAASTSTSNVAGKSPSHFLMPQNGPTPVLYKYGGFDFLSTANPPDEDLEQSFAAADSIAKHYLKEANQSKSPGYPYSENSTSESNHTFNRSSMMSMDDDSVDSERSISVQSFLKVLSVTKQPPPKSILTPGRSGAGYSLPLSSSTKKGVTWGAPSFSPSPMTFNNTSKREAGGDSGGGPRFNAVMNQKPSPFRMSPLSDHPTSDTTHSQDSGVTTATSTTGAAASGAATAPLEKSTIIDEFEMEANESSDIKSSKNQVDKETTQAEEDNQVEEEKKEEEDEEVVDLNESIISVKDFVQFLQSEVGDFENSMVTATEAAAAPKHSSFQGSNVSISDDAMEEEYAKYHATNETLRSLSFVTLPELTSTQLSRLVFCLGPARDYRRIAEAIRKAGFDGLTLQEAYAYKDVTCILEDLRLKPFPNCQSMSKQHRNKLLSQPSSKKYIHPLASMKFEMLLASLLREKGVDNVPTQVDVENMKEYVQSMIEMEKKATKTRGSDNHQVQDDEQDDEECSQPFKRHQRYELRAAKAFRKEKEEEEAELQIRKEKHYRKRVKIEEKHRKKVLSLDQDGIEKEDVEENDVIVSNQKRTAVSGASSVVSSRNGIMSPNLVKFIQQNSQRK